MGIIMSKKKLIIGGILAITALAVIITSVIFVLLSEDSTMNEYYEINHHRRGNNDIDRLIKRIYEEDSFLNEDELETPFISYKINKPVSSGGKYQMSKLEYNNNFYYGEDEVISDDYIGDKIETIEKVYDDSGKVEMELCSIKGLSTDLAIAVSEVGGEIKSLFFNIDYKEDNITKLIEDCGLMEHSVVAYGCLVDAKGAYSIKYTGITMEKVMEGMLGDVDSMTIIGYNPNIEKTGLFFRIYIEVLNMFFEITVLENGDLLMGFELYQLCGFSNENGIEKGIELINYMRDNFDGILRVY